MPKTKDAPVPAPGGSLAPQGKAKPDVDPELEGLMSEIESDLREDELKKIWKRYGSAIISFAVALVLGVLGFQLYRQYEARERLDAATRYEQAARDLDAGKFDEAIAGFKDVEQRRFAGGFKTLALLGEAATDLSKKDEDAAVAVYGKIAADSSVDPAYRSLATVLQALHSLDKADPKQLEAALNTVASPNNPFSHSAMELQALLAAKQGDFARARQIAEQILADPTAPTGVRQRATDLAALFKTQAPASSAPAPAAPPAPAAQPAEAPAPQAAAPPKP